MLLDPENLNMMLSVKYGWKAVAWLTYVYIYGPAAGDSSRSFLCIVGLSDKISVLADIKLNYIG